MSIGIKAEGGQSFLAMQIQARQLDQQIKTEVRALAREGRQKAANAIRSGKSGREYGATNARRAYKRVRRTVETFGGNKGSYMGLLRAQRAQKAYRASAPGEAPASPTGTLLRSLRIAYPTREKGYGAKVFANRGTAFYRHFLEFGTSERRTKKRAAGRIAPRPLFSPLQREMEGELESRLLRAIARFGQNL